MMATASLRQLRGFSCYHGMTVLAGIGAMGFAAPAFHLALGIDGQSLPQG